MNDGLPVALVDTHVRDVSFQLLLVDSRFRRALDRMCTLAARLLDVPTALVALRDDDSLLFPNGTGTDESWTRRPDRQSFHVLCSHVIESAAPLIIENAVEDLRVHQIAADGGQAVAAYLGLPLRLNDGDICGAFCVTDTRPRNWSADHIDGLATIAACIVSEIELGALRQRTINGTPWFDHDSQRPAMALIAPGNNHRAQAEQALQESEERFRLLYERSPDGIMLFDPHDPSGTFPVVDANSAACAMHGYRRDELIGLPLMALIAETEQDEPLDAYLERLRAADMLREEDVHRRKDGSTFPVEYSTSLVTIGGKEYILGIDRDITERRHAQEALRTSDMRFRTAFSSSYAGMALIGLDGRFVEVNAALCDMLNYTSRELTAMTLEQITHRDDIQRSRAAVQKLAAGTLSHVEDEQRLLHKHGATVWALLSVAALHDYGGSPHSFIVQVQNITERKRIEESLRDSEERFRSAFVHASVGMALVAPSGQIIEANPALCTMLGYAEDELVQLKYPDFTHPDDIADDLMAMQQLLAGDVPSYHLEKRYVHRNGATIWGHLSVSLVRSPHAEPMYCIAQVQDITERKRVEQELSLARRRLIESREAERLHFARELHDGAVQQLLGITYQLVAKPYRVTDESRDDESQASQRLLKPQVVREEVLEVVSQLRGLMRELRPAGLEELGLVAALEGYIAQLQAEYEGNMPKIMAHLDPGDLQLPTAISMCLFRVVQEAVRNALHHANAKHITIELLFRGDRVKLRVRDDGCGFVVPGRVSQLVHGNHFGLVGMAERVAAVDGEFHIVAQPGQGTTIMVLVELNGRTLMEA